MNDNLIFVSYSSKSDQVATLLVNFLKSNSLNPYMDVDDVKAGDNIVERLRSAVKRAAAVILVLDQYSAKSAWCIAEVGAFLFANKPVIVYPTSDFGRTLPPFLAGIRQARTLSEVLDACRSLPLVADDNPTLNGASVDSLSRSGVVNAFRIPVEDHERENRVHRLVQDECLTKSKHFRLLASSGYNYLHPHGKVWKLGLGSAIENGSVSLYAVLASPFSEFAFARAVANHVAYDQWENRGMLKHLESLSEKQNVELRVTPHPVNCSLFLTSVAIFYDPYLWGRPGEAIPTENNFWVIEFQRASLSSYDCYGLLEQHFSFLWNTATPLGVFLGPDSHAYHLAARDFSARVNHELDRKRKDANTSE